MGIRKLLIKMFVTAVAVSSCNGGAGKHVSDVGEESVAVSDSASVVVPQYAKGFTVMYLDGGIRLVDISDPQKATDGKKKSKGMQSRFALVPRGMSATVPEGYVKVEIPVRRTIVMTMLQLSNFTILDSHDVIKGLTGTKNLYNADILERVKRGDIVKIGMEGNFDPELIMAAAPEVIFISPFKRGGYDAIKETGVTLVPHLGYKELDPLGQAEWIKFTAMFIGKEREANEIFDGIADRYNALKAKATAAKTKPAVFSGEMHGGNWYAVGGGSYLAQIFRDAGADYIMHDDNTGGVPVEYETMYSLAANADYWRVLNSYAGDFSYEALEKSEPRNALFKAFKKKQVIYCNMKHTPYYEISPVTPEKVLADFVAIFHPELMPADYEPTFYTLLK